MLDLEIFAQFSGEDFTSATTGRQVQLSRAVKQLAEDEDKLENEFTFINSPVITQAAERDESFLFMLSYSLRSVCI